MINILKKINYKKVLYTLTIITVLITIFQTVEAFHYLKQIKDYAYSGNAESIELGKYVKYAGKALNNKKEAELWIKILIMNILIISPIVLKNLKRKLIK